jgi:ABC-type transport system involved in multi-copper enzyme maturation permease subunit
MTWLTWRQFRAQTVLTGIALAALALYLIYLRGEIENYYDTKIVGCAADNCRFAIKNLSGNYGGQLSIAGAVLIAAPALIGIFWGAPLVTREIEERTDRLVWNQSITRARWLAVKLGVIALVTIVTMALFSLLLTWSASRYDQIVGDRFAAMSFDSRNLVPVGYGVFAFVLGTVVGMVLRRTLPAMAITLAAFALVQILVPSLVRPHLMTPKTITVALDSAAMGRMDGIGLRDDGIFIQQYTVPGGWALVNEAQLYKADGSPYTEADTRTCMGAGSREEHEACTIAQNLHFEHTYHPGSRYWPFQWIELGLFVFLSALLTAFGFWWLRKRV